MTRRLLGYVVKLPDGTRSEHTRRPVSLAYASAHLCDDGAVVPVFSKPKPAESKPAPLPPNPPCFCCGVGVEPGPRDDGFTDGERVVCGHCGATNYPTVADDGTVEMSDGAEDDDDETTPAPVVAAEGRYACLVRRHGFEFFYAETVELENQLHEKAVAEDVARRQRGWADAARVVRVFEDGAHEAALAVAREEGRREGAEAALHDARRTLLDLADDFTGDHAAGLRHSVRCIYDKIQATKEAAKGAAK